MNRKKIMWDEIVHGEARKKIKSEYNVQFIYVILSLV